MRTAFYYCLLPLIVVGIGYGAYRFTATSKNLNESPESDHESSSFKGEPFSLNLGPGVGEGFRGEFHPLLHGKTELTLTADWRQVGNGRYVSEMMPPEMCRYILSLKPATARKTCSKASSKTRPTRTSSSSISATSPRTCKEK